MFKSSLSRKLFGLFGTFLIMFNSFAWGPWDAGQNLLKKCWKNVRNSLENE